MQADRVGVAASRRARASTSRLRRRTMRPRRSPDPWRHHPLERVWCSIRSGSFSVGLSYTSAVLGIPVQPSRKLDINLTWQTSEHLVILPWSDRLRPAVRCGGVAPPTAGRSRLRRRRRPLSRPRAGLRASEPREWPLTDTVTNDRLSQSSPPLIVDSLESLTARVNAS